MENKRIDGEKVYLTTISYSDCEDFVRWRNSDFVKTKFIIRKDLTVEDQVAWIKNQVETGNVIQFIIWDKNDNKKIGSVYLQHIDRKELRCEFGILIGEKGYTGRGLGTEANSLILQYAFEELKMKEVYLRVLKKNERAIRSYLKSGYKQTDVLSEEMSDGKEEEVVYMSRYKE